MLEHAECVIVISPAHTGALMTFMHMQHASAVHRYSAQTWVPCPDPQVQGALQPRHTWADTLVCCVPVQRQLRGLSVSADGDPIDLMEPTHARAMAAAAAARPSSRHNQDDDSSDGQVLFSNIFAALLCMGAGMGETIRWLGCCWCVRFLADPVHTLALEHCSSVGQDCCI